MYNVIGRCWDINFGGFLMKLKYTFNSIFKNHIKDFIFEKRSMGYKYEENEYTLYRFDKYCVENNISSLNLTKEDLLGWITKKTQKQEEHLMVVSVWLGCFCCICHR